MEMICDYNTHDSTHCMPPKNMPRALVATALKTSWGLRDAHPIPSHQTRRQREIQTSRRCARCGSIIRYDTMQNTSL